MSDVKEIRSIINKYIQEAIIEYSDLEDLRHEALSFVDDNDKRYSGHSKKAIKREKSKIVEILEEGEPQELEKKALEILKRSNIKDAYLQLNNKDKRIFHYELLKGETNILIHDKNRTVARLEESANIVGPKGFEAFTQGGIAPTLVNALNKEFPVETSAMILQAATSVQVQPQSEGEKSLANRQEENDNRWVKHTIREIANTYLKLKAEEITKTNTFNAIKTEIERFLDYFPNKIYPIDFNIENMVEYADRIKKLPNKKMHRQLYRTYNFIEITDKYEYFLRTDYMQLVKEYKLSEKPTKLDFLSEKTINEKLGKVSNFLDYCVKKEFLDKNRLNGERFDKPKPKSIRVYFEQQELNNMLESDWYTLNLEEHLKNRPERFFIPLIGLYSGFRGNEIAQLTINDIILKDDIYCYHINTNNENQRTKTDNSKRLIPIHSKIIELGFIKFVEQIKQKKGTRLFSRLNYYPETGYWKDFGDDFNEKLKVKMVKKELLDRKDLSIDFHSFRHNFSHSLKGKIEDRTLSAAMGHAIEGMSHGRYGSEYPVEVLQDAIEKLDYKLDFSKILAVVNKIYK